LTTACSYELPEFLVTPFVPLLALSAIATRGRLPRTEGCEGSLDVDDDLIAGSEVAGAFEKTHPLRDATRVDHCVDVATKVGEFLRNGSQVSKCEAKRVKELSVAHFVWVHSACLFKKWECVEQLATFIVAPRAAVQRNVRRHGDELRQGAPDAEVLKDRQWIDHSALASRNGLLDHRVSLVLNKETVGERVVALGTTVLVDVDSEAKGAPFTCSSDGVDVPKDLWSSVDEVPEGLEAKVAIPLDLR